MSNGDRQRKSSGGSCARSLLLCPLESTGKHLFRISSKHGSDKDKRRKRYGNVRSQSDVFDRTTRKDRDIPDSDSNDDDEGVREPSGPGLKVQRSKSTVGSFERRNARSTLSIERLEHRETLRRSGTFRRSKMLASSMPQQGQSDRTVAGARPSSRRSLLRVSGRVAGRDSVLGRSFRNGRTRTSSRRLVTLPRGSVAETLEDELIAAGVQNVLHVACRSHPPLFIVERMVEEHPDCAWELNGIGQTPLHVAAAHGASPQVVSYLLEKCPSAASLGDVRGRTPLLLACDKCCREGALCDVGNEYGDVSSRGPLLKVIKPLCEAAPDCVNNKDEYGVTALEYAICRGATVRVVKTLHKASKKGWELQAKAEEARKRSVNSAPDHSSGPLEGVVGRRTSGRAKKRSSTLATLSMSMSSISMSMGMPSLHDKSSEAEQQKNDTETDDKGSSMTPSILSLPPSPPTASVCEDSIPGARPALRQEAAVLPSTATTPNNSSGTLADAVDGGGDGSDDCDITSPPNSPDRAAMSLLNSSNVTAVTLPMERDVEVDDPLHLDDRRRMLLTTKTQRGMRWLFANPSTEPDVSVSALRSVQRRGAMALGATHRIYEDEEDDYSFGPSNACSFVDGEHVHATAIENAIALAAKEESNAHHQLQPRKLSRVASLTAKGA